MGYDISLKADMGNGMVKVGCLEWNYTSNCSPMWKEAGIDLAEFDGIAASSLVPELSKALQALIDDPSKYEAMNPDNGWGSYVTLIVRLKELLEGLTEAPNAIVNVWY